MKRWIALGLLAALALPLASAQLSYFPWHFVDDGKFSGVIVVGAEASSKDVFSASDIAVYIQTKLKGDKITGGTKLDVQIKTLNQNLIAVGDPCHNAVVAQILSIPTPCTAFFPAGEGYLILKEYPDHVHLIVTGGTPDDTARVATVLGKHANYKTKDYINLITGDAEPFNITSLSEKEFAAKFPGADASGTGPANTSGDSGGGGGSGSKDGDGSGGTKGSGSTAGTNGSASSGGTAGVSSGGPGTPNATADANGTGTDSGGSKDVPLEEKNPNIVVRFFRWFFGLFKR